MGTRAAATPGAGAKVTGKQLASPTCSGISSNSSSEDESVRFKASVLSTLSRRRRQADSEADDQPSAPNPPAHTGSKAAPAATIVQPREQSADTSDSDDILPRRTQLRRTGQQAGKASATSSRSRSSSTEAPEQQPQGDRTLTAGAPTSRVRHAEYTATPPQVAAQEGAISPQSGLGGREGRAGPAVTPARSGQVAATFSPLQVQHSRSLPVREASGTLHLTAAAPLAVQSTVGSSPEARSRPALGSRPRPASPPSPGQHSQTPKQQVSSHLIHRQPSTQEQPSSPKQGPSSHASFGGLAGTSDPPVSLRQRQQGPSDGGLEAQFLGSTVAARNATAPPHSPGNAHTAHGSLGVHPGRSSTDGALGSYAFSPRGAVDPGTQPRARASYSGRVAVMETRQRSSSGTPEPSSPSRRGGAFAGTSADDSSGGESAHALLPRMGPAGAQIEQSLRPRSSRSGTTGPPSPHPPKGPGPAWVPDSLTGSGYQQQQQQPTDRYRNPEAQSVRWAAGESGPGIGQQWQAARDASSYAGAPTSAQGSFGVPEAHTPSQQRRAQTYGGDSSPYLQPWPVRAAASTPGGHDLRQQQPTTSASLPFPLHTAATPHWQGPLPATTPAARPATYSTPAPPAYTPLGAMSTPDLAAWPFHASPAPSSSAARLGTQSRTLAVTDGEEVGLQLLPRYPSAKCDLIDLP